MKIIGISAFYHDSAATLISENKIIGAVQEERFTRKKHDNRFPINSIKWLLRDNNLSMNDIDSVVFYEDPWLKFNRIWNSYLYNSPSGITTFSKAVKMQIKKAWWLHSILRKDLGYKGKIDTVLHHESHAAAAFYPSPFKDAAFLTIDGVGEWDTVTYGVGNNKNIKILKRIQFPHSLGLLYSAFTAFTGFKINSGEYKVMGLAPYGEPKYVDLILDNLIDLKDDGSFRLNMKYFDYVTGDKTINQNFENLFSKKQRKSESDLSQDDMDLARSIQEVIEYAVIKIAKNIKKETNQKYLCLSGGVALNCVANGKLLKEKIFDDIWIQPAAGDAGNSLGAALHFLHNKFKKERHSIGEKNSQYNNYYLGPKYSNEYIKDFLDFNEIPYTFEENIEKVSSKLLAEGNVLGWFNGRMEFGPRALGGRSILGDPRHPDMQKKMNLKIKFRESFRPFAPSILEEKASEWFEIDRPSPHMLLVADVKKEKRLEEKINKNLKGLDLLNVARSEIPAVTHVDFSARIQTVNKKNNPKYYNRLKNFDEETNCPVLINTSFNVRGEPIVQTPKDAYRCFMRTGMDYLVLENFILCKKDQSTNMENEEWMKEFELD